MSATDIGVIFDMDGVIIDNHRYHTLAWEAFWAKHSLPVSKEQYTEHINGKTNNDIMRYLFGDDTSQERVDELAYDKEKMYRDLYEDHISIASGLDTLLHELKENNVKLAVASAGPPENVSFALDLLDIRHYFSSVIDSSMVTRGKPDPEAYDKSVLHFGLAPANCLIFEDSFLGIQAAKSSGCTTVGIASSHSRQELETSNVDYIIDSFQDIKLDLIRSLIAEK